MQTNLVLIRHGSIENPDDVIYGFKPFPISEKGQRELHDLGAELTKRKLKPLVIYTSPLVRNIQTANALKTKFYPDVEVKKDDLLKDIDVGSLEGQPMEAFRKQKFNISVPHSGGETPDQFMRRVVSSLKTLIAKHEGKTIFCVIHGDWIRYALWYFQHPDQEIDLKNLRDDDYVYPGEALILKFEGNNFAEYEHIRRERFQDKERQKNPLKEAY